MMRWMHDATLFFSLRFFFGQKLKKWFLTKTQINTQHDNKQRGVEKESIPES